MRIRESVPLYGQGKKQVTYQDYRQLPPDDFRHQLIEGEIVMTPASKVVHQIVKNNWLKAFQKFVESQQLGLVLDAPCDVYLDEHNVVQPDVFFISRDRLAIVTEEIVKGAPDLILEVLSPASAYYDLVEKKALYARFGVKEYWIVDPKWQWAEVYWNANNAFQLHQRAEKEGGVHSRLFPEFEVSLNEIFHSVPPGNTDSASPDGTGQ